LNLLMQRPRSSAAGRRRERAFGRVLQQIRAERGLSQEVLGFESGYHRTYISFLERGKKSPSLSTIMDLAETLCVPASEILRRVESLLKLKFEPT
jgi:transcriptional regulator with XRE-family HTH domain